MCKGDAKFEREKPVWERVTVSSPRIGLSNTLSVLAQQT
jgi:hypothetical protein